MSQDILVLLTKARRPKLSGGWIAWRGGQNPVGNQHVRYRMRGDDEYSHGPNVASDLRWDDQRHPADIVAYKLA